MITLRGPNGWIRTGWDKNRKKNVATLIDRQKKTWKYLNIFFGNCWWYLLIAGLCFNNFNTTSWSNCPNPVRRCNMLSMECESRSWNILLALDFNSTCWPGDGKSGLQRLRALNHLMENKLAENCLSFQMRVSTK